MSADALAARPNPRLTVGLPVYNGERYLSQSLDALLAQTFTDFELIIADNASTDETAAIAQAYATADPRVRFVRHPKNLGSAGNHNFVVNEARGEFFKWASDDDLYAPELLERCIEALDARPEIVLAHAWTAFIDETGAIIHTVDYSLRTDEPSAPERFHSLLHTWGGDDFYGVVRTSVMQRVAPHGSYHNADRTFVSNLALQGPFHQEPDYLYFRRDHPGRASSGGARSRSARLDPRRANSRRHPVARLVGEYVMSYVGSILAAPISRADRLKCLAYLTSWVLGHANPLRGLRLLDSPDPSVRARGAKTLVSRIAVNFRAANPLAGSRTGH